MSSKLSSIQRQLHPDYHRDRFLRDQLIRSADNPEIVRALKERIPQYAHEANQRIAALLSSEAGSAARYYEATGSNPHDNINFEYDTRFGGSARKHLKGGGFRQRQRKSRKVKGCWVCGKNHFARDYHEQREIRSALERHKREGRLYISIDDVTKICDEEDGTEILVNPADNGSESTSDMSSNDDMVNFGLSQVNTHIEQKLAEKAFIHGFDLNYKHEIEYMKKELDKPEDFKPTFQGVMLDTGANRSSVMSLQQYYAYCRECLRPAALQTARIDPSSKRTMHGFAGSSSTIGHADIVIPIQRLNIAPTIRFHIVNHECPKILCLMDMKRLGLEISIQDNCLLLGYRRQRLVLEKDLLRLKWKPCDQILYTEDELRKLHKSFGHPSAKALSELLKRARPDERYVRDELEQIVKECLTCARYSRKPRRFKLTVGTEENRFNHIVAVDIVHIDGKHILHCVDESTHFGAASILPSMRSEDLWKYFLKCWSLIYLGPPDFLRVDQGSNLVSAEFRASASADGITVLEAPVESAETMSHVDRYHAPLRAAYLKIKSCMPRTRPPDILQMAVKAVNDTTGPEGLCPTLLVFGTIPKPARPTIAPTQLQRAEAIEHAMKEVSKVQSKRRVNFGLKHIGPVGGERHDLDNLFPGAHVLVYRTKSKKWEGPFIFIDKVGETVCVQLPYGRQVFRSKAVKPAPPAIQTEEVKSPVELFHIHDTYFGNFNDCELDFTDARSKELRGLIERQVFEIVERVAVPQNMRVYKTRWVDTVKKLDNGASMLKSRLVSKSYRDAAATAIPTRSPTVSRWAQRLALCFAAMSPERDSYTRDISQAYVQSEDKLSREVYLEPPPEMDLENKFVLKAIKPLYGIPESGLYWFETYHRHHTTRLKMSPSKADPCFLYRRDEEDTEKFHIPNFAILQVDDSFGNGTLAFLEDEEKKVQKFDCKPRIILKPGVTTKFNGVTTSRPERGVYKISQPDKLSSETPSTKENLVSVRAKFQYVAGCSRPDISGPVQLLAKEVRSPKPDTFSTMGKIVDYCRKTKDEGLKFVFLNPSALRLVLFTDAAFANAENMSSQLGFVLLLTDDTDRCNIVHYGSVRCRRVTRSVMAAELLALVYGFDNSFIVRHTIQEALDYKIPLDAYGDSRTAFNTVAKGSNPLEKRLQIDASAIRQSHKSGEIRTLGWIPGSDNPADGLTREGIVSENHPLRKIMRDNIVRINPTGWASDVSQ